jgi:hypothetical protein
MFPGGMNLLYKQQQIISIRNSVEIITKVQYHASKSSQKASTHKWYFWFSGKIESFVKSSLGPHWVNESVMRVFCLVGGLLGGEYVQWRATKEGTYYFSSNKLVEGLGTHCKAGQKLAITVTAAKVTTTTMSSSTKESKPESIFGQRFTRSMIESLATAPAVAPVSPPAPVPVGAPVPVVAPPVVAPVAAPVLTPTPTPSTSLPLTSPPAPPTGPAPAPASPPGHNAGARVSTQAGAGIFTATLALVTLCL